MSNQLVDRAVKPEGVTKENLEAIEQAVHQGKSLVNLPPSINKRPTSSCSTTFCKKGEIGLEFLPRLKEIAAHVPVIVISGTLDVRAQLAVLSGPRSAHYVIEKPVDVGELEKTVDRALNECGFAETVAALRSLEDAEKIESGDRERLFTERLARQLELIRRFRRATDKPNISQLAEEFCVDRKTIRRDLHDLATRGQLPREIMESSPEA